MALIATQELTYFFHPEVKSMEMPGRTDMPDRTISNAMFMMLPGSHSCSSK